MLLLSQNADESGPHDDETQYQKDWYNEDRFEDQRILLREGPLRANKKNYLTGEGENNARLYINKKSDLISYIDVRYDWGQR